MQIVVDFRCEVKEYCEKCRTGDVMFECPGECASCGSVGSMIGHGYYIRKALDSDRLYLVPIKRWLCKICKQTLSLLPSFLLRFRHYLVVAIQEVIVARYEQERSWEEMKLAFGYGGAALRTMQRWCRSMEEHASEWLGSIERYLAEQDSGSSWLDVHGKAAQASNEAQALLQASMYLLAWAKVRWKELEAYGLAKRLSFLWHWGFSRELKRLI